MFFDILRQMYYDLQNFSVLKGIEILKNGKMNEICSFYKLLLIHSVTSLSTTGQYHKQSTS